MNQYPEVKEVIAAAVAEVLTTTAIDDTEIKYDRITRDYAILVHGVAIGYGRNYSEAEAKRTAYLGGAK